MDIIARKFLVTLCESLPSCNSPSSSIIVVGLVIVVIIIAFLEQHRLVLIFLIYYSLQVEDQNYDYLSVMFSSQDVLFCFMPLCGDRTSYPGQSHFLPVFAIQY